MYQAAFIGLGRIASLLEDDPLREKPASHAGAVAADPDCVITGGFDVDEGRRRLFADRWGCPVFATPEEMLDEVRADIVIIATHPDSHERYVRFAAARNAPVVICEKPLAHTTRSARRIAALERRETTRIIVNHERRFSRDFQLAAKAVSDAVFGNLVSVSARLFFGQTARRDRVFLHDGTHLVDAINFLTADHLRLHRRFGRMRSNRSSAFLLGSTTRGIPVMIEHGSERDYLVFDIRLSFERGEILVGNGEFQWRRSVESPFYTGYRSLASSSRTRPEPSGYFAGMVREAVALLDNPSRRSASRAEDALAVMKVIRSSRSIMRGT